MQYNDPEHWRARAAEARALAEKMTCAVSKEEMIEVAEKYDQLAERALVRMAPGARARPSAAV